MVIPFCMASAEITQLHLAGGWYLVWKTQEALSAYMIPPCFSVWPCYVAGFDILTAWLSLVGWTSYMALASTESNPKRQAPRYECLSRLCSHHAC